MAKRLTYNILTGNDTRLGMCFYYSPYFDQNIWRRSSSLTGERTKKDPAFKGFRQSSSRLKQASPIAASLYKLVPVQVKQYDLYRTLTGEAIKMLKEGMEAALITESLKKKYIDPLLEIPEKSLGNRLMEEPEKKDRVTDLRNFNSYPQMPSGLIKPAGTRRSLLRKIREARLEAVYFSIADSSPLPQTGRNFSATPPHEPELPEQPKRRTKTTSGLIYMGRLHECKKLKIWLRPVEKISTVKEFPF
jgi:hypothetical protein